MPQSKRTERKVVASLFALIEQEERQLLKIRFLAWSLSISGGLLVGFFFIPAIKEKSQAGWFMGVGLVAGILIGLSVYFFSSLAQWPVVRRFLNIPAIKDAHSELRP